MGEYKDIHAGLVEACRAHDQTAQRKLYDLYVEAMYNTSLRILKSREEAEDIVQEAFIEAFTKIHSFKGKSTFGAWLKRIVINKSINQTKKRKIEYDDVDERKVDVEDEQVEEMIPYTIENVKQALNGLSEGYRVVFTLFAFEGYSHQQIADELGITESTSKSQYNRAKKRIKELVIKQNYERSAG